MRTCIPLGLAALWLVASYPAFASDSESHRCDLESKIIIRDESYEDRDHFVIETPAATYWLDKRAGGLSRLIDIDGSDWINFKMKPWGKYPESSAGAYRGMPNLLFGDGHRESGFGHPGWDRATSRKESDHTIVCTSDSGQWQLRWEFSETSARLAVERFVSDAPYWFLYEGPIAGRWSPERQYFATNTSPPEDEPVDYFAGNRRVGNWRWAYFGDQNTERVLFILHEQQDQHADTFSFLGNSKRGIASSDGMVVFGFGRGPKGIEPLLRNSQSFRIGLLEQGGKDDSSYRSIERRLNSFLQPAAD